MWLPTLARLEDRSRYSRASGYFMTLMTDLQECGGCPESGGAHIQITNTLAVNPSSSSMPKITKSSTDLFRKLVETASPHGSHTASLHLLIVAAGGEMRLSFSVLGLEEKFGTLLSLFQ